MGGPLVKGLATEKYIEKMNEAGVEISVLLASKGVHVESQEENELPAVRFLSVLITRSNCSG